VHQPLVRAALKSDAYLPNTLQPSYVKQIDSREELEWGPRRCIFSPSNYEQQFRPTETTNVDVRAPDLKHRRQMVYYAK
jgi:hypothetical protein